MIYKFKNDNVWGRLVDGKMEIVENFHQEKKKYAWPVGMRINPVMELWEIDTNFSQSNI